MEVDTVETVHILGLVYPWLTGKFTRRSQELSNRCLGRIMLREDRLVSKYNLEVPRNQSRQNEHM